MKVFNDIIQGTPEWKDLKLGKPSGSKAKLLVTSKGEPSKSWKDYAVTLANEIYLGEKDEDFKGSKAMERGILLEPDARKAYEFVKNVESNQVGFITDDLIRYGVSPDSLINDDGLSEYKCQESKGHTNTLLYFNRYKKLPTDHVAQVQMQMMVSEREWNDTVHYHPKLPMVIVRSYPDPVIVRQLQIQLANVLEERDRVIEILRAS